MNIFNRDSHHKRQVVPLANILTVISASGVSNTRMLQRSRYADMSIAEIFHALNQTSSIFLCYLLYVGKITRVYGEPPYFAAGHFGDGVLSDSEYATESLSPF